MSSTNTQVVTIIGGASVDIYGKSTDAIREHDSNPGTVHKSPGGVARNIEYCREPRAT
jgi:pseudouridine kinase